MKKILLVMLILNTFTLGVGFLVEPQCLIHPLRFDLMAKYIYAKYRELGVNSKFAKDLYAAHLQAMNDFYEELPVKNSLSDYINSFHSILDGVKNVGYQASKCKELPIWVKKTNTNPGGLYYCDGSHRVSACLLYNKDVAVDRVEKSDVLPPYNYRFLRRKKLAEKYMDAMALEYCKLSKKCFLLFLFPRFKGDINEVHNCLGGDEKIVYTKKINLNNIQGQMNLLDQLYSGWNSYTPGAMHDWEGYFPEKNNGVVNVFLFESDSLDSVKKIKAKIRNENHSHFTVHTTDEPAETLEMAKLVFVGNSLHFLKNRKFGEEKKLETFLAQYKKWLVKNRVDEECFCVDGSAIMAAYGLRDCRDLDFLHHGYDHLLSQLKTDDISSHNCEMGHHVKHKDEIIFNPDNYFYYRGVKFGALDIVRSMKEKRAEKPKDFKDLNLINKIK